MLRVFSQSLGCPKNLVDTEHVLGALGTLAMVDDPVSADFVFINTCAFIGSAVVESVRTIAQLLEDVSDKKPFIAVAGCLVGRYGAGTLAEDLPEVDLWLGTENIDDWPQITRTALAGAGILGTSALGGMRLLSTGPSYAWLKIGEGCRHKCTFCTIPSIRGEYRSGSLEHLAAEAQWLVSGGVKELVLVAQDVTAWGSDLDDPRGDLRPLLEKLLVLSGLKRLRLMYLYPGGLTDDLLRFLKQSGDVFVPYFDVPLQHSAQNVLSRMGRPFAGNPRIAIEKIRKYFPEAALRTSLMVGFPGETEEDFRDLVRFVESERFLHMGVFAYEPEDGTEAALMQGQISDAVKDERKGILMELQADISADILRDYEGSRQLVLVDGPHPEWPGLYKGRTWFQAPEVDGITYISGPGVCSGAYVEADITESKDYDLVALA
ncbi:MAG: 30S ribosomal protein S12 methylthiotransferase RimO [Mailhella sp.]|nr:30S ribosomal protein S12 methylthiotransferase RimO [Mailhella sp.]